MGIHRWGDLYHLPKYAKRMGCSASSAVLPPDSRPLQNPEKVSKPPEEASHCRTSESAGSRRQKRQFRGAEDIERAFSAFATDRPDGPGRPNQPGLDGPRERSSWPSFRAESGSQSCIRSARCPRGESHRLRSPLPELVLMATTLCREKFSKGGKRPHELHSRAAHSVRNSSSI